MRLLRRGPRVATKSPHVLWALIVEKVLLRLLSAELPLHLPVEWRE